jgi:hypothetical protein
MIDLPKLSKKIRCVKTSVSLPADLRREARRVSRRHGVSLSRYVSQVVAADLAERSGRIR